MASTGKLVSGWTVNGITQFQTGFPIALQDAAPNLFETDFAIGNGGPGPPGAGVSRPDYVPGCNKAAPNTSTLQSHLAAVVQHFVFCSGRTVGNRK